MVPPFVYPPWLQANLSGNLFAIQKAAGSAADDSQNDKSMAHLPLLRRIEASDKPFD